MALNCEAPGATRKRYGFGKAFMDRLQQRADISSSKSNVRNIARNLGVDDTRTLNLEYTTKGGNKKKLFGDNLTDASEWNPMKGDTPQNVVVKMHTKEGGEQFYMSSKDATLEPSRWVLDGTELKPNPDWNAVGVNKTLDDSGAPRLFVKDNERGVYRLPREDETGEVYLNIQNPVKDGNYNPREIAEQGIDAFEVAPNQYRVVHHSQVVDPASVTKKPKYKALDKSRKEVGVADQTIAEELMQMGLKNPLATSVAGALGGGLVSEDSAEGAFWGGALGFALGSKKIRTKAKGVYYDMAGKGADEYDRAASQSMQAEKAQAENQRLYSEGYRGTMERTKDWFKETISEPMRNLKESGRSIKRLLVQNDVVESGHGVLSWFNVPKADELRGVLSGFDSAGNKLYARLGRIQDEMFENGKQGFRQTQVRFMRQMFGDMPEQEAIDSFGAAVRRIITHETKLGDDGLQFADTAAARQMYTESARRVDEAVLRDEQARKVVEATRRFYENVRKETVDTLTTKMNDLAASLEAPYRRMAERLVESDMSWKEFTEANPSGQWTQTIKHMKKEASDKTQDFWESLKEMSSDRARFKELEGKYVPQKMNYEKIRRMKEDFMERGDFETAAKAEEAWERNLSERVLENNRDQWKRLTETEEGIDVMVRRFGSWNKAKGALKADIRGMDNLEAQTRLLDMIEDNANEWIVKQGNHYTLEVPERLRGVIENPFKESNLQKITGSRKYFYMKNMAAESDFFDKPRRYVLPDSMLKTDMEDLAKDYTQDFGIRLHAIKNDMYDKQGHMLYHRYLSPTAKQAKEKGIDEGYIEDYIGRIESWVATMQGNNRWMKIPANEKARIARQREFRNKQKNALLWKMAGDLAVQPFLYGVTMYSPFQPLVFGPFFAGYKNVAKAYKMYFRNPEGLNRMLREQKEMNVIRETYESYSPEHKLATGTRALDDEQGKKLVKWANRINSMAQFSANLSLSKPVLKMFNKNIEDLGLSRLAVGNLIDISGAEAGLVTMASLKKIEDLVSAGRKISEGADNAKVGRTTYNMKKIEEELRMLGVEQPQRFIENKRHFNRYVEYLEGKKDRKILESLDEDVKNYLQDEYTSINQTIVDSYHGRSKLARPRLWVDNSFGRILARFSVYSQNFGIQTTKRRIYEPIKDWHDMYKTVDGQNPPMMKIAWAASKGDDKFFKKTFGEQINEATGNPMWKDAYDDLPVQAINNTFKVLGALGVGKAMLISRNGFMDVLGIATNEALGNDDYEAWRGVNRSWTIGEDPQTGESITIGDLFADGPTGYEMLKLFQNGLYTANRLAVFGRWAQIAAEDLRFPSGGPLQVTPVTGMAQEFWETLGNITHHTSLADAPEQIGRTVLDKTLNYAPAAGPFYDMRKAIFNSIFQKPKNRNSGGYIDSETGLELEDPEFPEL